MAFETAKVLAQNKLANRIEGDKSVPLGQVDRRFRLFGSILLAEVGSQLADQLVSVFLDNTFLAAGRTEREKVLVQELSNFGVLLIRGVEERPHALSVAIGLMFGKTLVPRPSTVDILPSGVGDEGKLIWCDSHHRAEIFVELPYPVVEITSGKLPDVRQSCGTPSFRPWETGQWVEKDIICESSNKSDLEQELGSGKLAILAVWSS